MELYYFDLIRFVYVYACPQPHGCDCKSLRANAMDQIGSHKLDLDPEKKHVFVTQLR